MNKRSFKFRVGTLKFDLCSKLLAIAQLTTGVDVNKDYFHNYPVYLRRVCKGLHLFDPELTVGEDAVGLTLTLGGGISLYLNYSISKHELTAIQFTDARRGTYVNLNLLTNEVFGIMLMGTKEVTTTTYDTYEEAVLKFILLCDANISTFGMLRRRSD